LFKPRPVRLCQRTSRIICPRVVYFLVSLSILNPLAFSQRAYYISSDGSDSNTGTSEATPWKSTAKINTTTFVAGDQILFRRGDEFLGQMNINQSGTSALPITIGSYGNASQEPKITGATRITNWSVYSGPVYMAQASASAKALYANGQQMTVARFPDTGFLTITSTEGSTTISSPELAEGNNYWAGATVRVRPNHSLFETRTIAASSGSTITLAKATDAPLLAGWGFYIDNKLPKLDVPGEWYCDPATNTVYFYPPGGVDPNGLDIEANVLDYGVTSTRSYIIIKDLEFRCQTLAAIRFSGTTSNNQILNNIIVGGLLSGIQIDGTSSNYTIDGNRLRDINGRGIHLVSTKSSTITNNVVKRIGMVQGYGVSGPNGMNGIFLQGGSHNAIRANTVDSAGYIGIRADGSYSTVENNLITNTMMKLADGGALYCYSDFPLVTYGLVFRNNIIKDVTGDVAGVPEPTWKTANGIYLDHGSYDVLVEGNTIIRAQSAGLFMQVNSYRNTIRNNLFYDCGGSPGGYFLEIDYDTTKNHGQNLITRNVFYPLDSVQTLVAFSERNSYCHVPGILDSNYYCNPYNNLPIRLLTYTNTWSGRDLTLEQWKSYSGQDRNSKGLFSQLDPFVVTDSSAASLIANGEFGSGISGWSDWADNTLLSYTNAGGLDGGCLKFKLRDGAGTNRAAASPILQVNEGQWYQVRFSARASQDGVFTVVVRQAHAPYAEISGPVPFLIGPTRTDERCYVQTNSTDSETRIEFRVTYPDTVFYLDNVIFRPVAGSYVPAHELSPIFVNTSSQPTTFELGDATYKDVDGQTVAGSFTLPPYSSRVLVRISGTGTTTDTGSNNKAVPGTFALMQNFPNPFNPLTHLRYSVPAAGGQQTAINRVRIAIYDLLGREVAVLMDEMKEAGTYEVKWNAAGFSSGVYVCRMTAGAYVQTLKMLLMK
jgi:parallel beta-helix repeat protein